jgi:hypothetical protein
MARDVQPIVEELKAKWKNKIATLEQERSHLNHEIV